MDERYFDEISDRTRVNNSSTNRLGDFGVGRDSRPANPQTNFDNSYRQQQFVNPYASAAQPINPQPAQPVQQPQQTAYQAHFGNSSGTVIHKPKTYEDVKLLIDHLRMNEQIIVDFSTISQATVYRILDFLSGAVYALNGTIQKITDQIILFAPAGVSVTIPPSLATK